ncbi:MAG: hypothetical protein V3T98_02225 [Candidatus Paceibacterota bacterium]
MTKKTIKLPSAEEIIKRLKNVYDNDHVAERFYPMIAKEAKKQLVAEGVTMMFTLKIHDFVASGYRYPGVIEDILHMYVPSFIDAIIDDKEVAEAAKVFHQEALHKDKN